MRNFCVAPKRSGGVLFLALFALATTSAFADDSVGGAEVVVNLVNGSLASGSVVKVAQGDGVYRDEQVRTDKESFVRLLLSDKTSLALGPSSAIKIDQFVYGGEGQSGTIAVNLAKGALRFVTGNAAKSAYLITTPTATLGVRGTILHIHVTATKTDVLLEEGGAVVCVRKFADQRCQELDHANAVASVSATAVSVSTATPDSVHALSVPSQPGNSSSTGSSSTHGTGSGGGGGGGGGAGGH